MRARLGSLKTTSADSTCGPAMARETICDYIARLPAEASGSLRRVDNTRVAGRFLECDLSSVFQPVFAADGGVVGLGFALARPSP